MVPDDRIEERINWINFTWYPILLQTNIDIYIIPLKTIIVTMMTTVTAVGIANKRISALYVMKYLIMPPRITYLLSFFRHDIYSRRKQNSIWQFSKLWKNGKFVLYTLHKKHEAYGCLVVNVCCININISVCTLISKDTKGWIEI